MTHRIELAIAQVDDIPALCGLLEVLFSQELEFIPNPEAHQRGLRGIIDNPQIGFILIGKVGGYTAGMVNMLFTISTALGERVALLEDMVVAPAYRGSGIGAALIERAIVEARERGCKRVTLLTDAANAAAQRFYRHHGFEKSTMLVFRRMLEA